MVMSTVMVVSVMCPAVAAMAMTAMMRQRRSAAAMTAIVCPAGRAAGAAHSEAHAGVKAWSAADTPVLARHFVAQRIPGVVVELLVVRRFFLGGVGRGWFVGGFGGRIGGTRRGAGTLREAQFVVGCASFMQQFLGRREFGVQTIYFSFQPSRFGLRWWNCPDRFRRRRPDS